MTTNTTAARYGFDPYLEWIAKEGLPVVEDYGIDLLRDYLANVHIKNASWVRQAGNWTWQWDGLQQGMVPWPQLFGLLAARGYRGMLAMEDFLVPRSYDAALEHLAALRREATLLLSQAGSRRAA